MKKGLLISFLLLILMVSVFIGCSDDDENSIVAAAAAQGYLIGYVNYYPSFEFYADILPMTNDGFTIDSIITNDSIADYRDESYWHVYGDGNYQWAYLSSDSTDYLPGDTVEVNFYRNNAVADLSIRLIDYDIYPNYILPINNDTIALDEPLDIIWNIDQDADWYGIYYSYYRDSAGVTNYVQTYVATTDTAFTIPASDNIYNGYYWIYVMAVNGPGTGEPLNLDGAGLIGEFHSYTGSDYRLIFVGTGSANPVSNNPDEPEIDSHQASKMMMDHFTGHELKADNH